jgi:triacylglycerol lipase
MAVPATRASTLRSAEAPATPAQAPQQAANAARGAAEGLFGRSLFQPVGKLIGGANDVAEKVLAAGLYLAAGGADESTLKLVRAQLNRVLGQSSVEQVGWIQKEGAPTRDVTASFRELYAQAAAGKSALPAEAKDHVYLTLRGYTGDNWPTYMKGNREGLARQGLDVREVKTDTEATVETNARVVRDAVMAAAKEGKKVVLIGHSKGGMDLTAAVALYPEIKPHVRAAVTMQSPYGGVPLASDTHRHAVVRKLAGLGLELVLKGDKESYRDFTYQVRQDFVRKNPWPTDIPTVSLASSSSAQLNGLSTTSNYYRLRYGTPSDGVVATHDSVVPGSNVVRLDDLDHLNSVMKEFPGLSKYDPGDLTVALVGLALTTPPVVRS